MKAGSRASRAPAILSAFWPAFLPDRLAAAFRRGARARGLAALVGADLAGPALAALDCSFALLLECQTLFFSAAISSMVRAEGAESGISSRISGSDFLPANSSVALIR